VEGRFGTGLTKGDPVADVDRVLEVALSNSPYSSPGPNRAGLEAIRA